MKRCIQRFGVVLLCCCAGPSLEGQVERQKVQRQVLPLLEAELTPGSSVALWKDGRTQHFGFGALTFGGKSTPTRHTIYEAGSITKVFTGVLLAEGVRRGEVKLSDPLEKQLPEGVRLPESWSSSPTLVSLATHTSGLPRLPANLRPKQPADPYQDYSQEDLWEFLRSWKATRPPGKRYEYSNLGAGLSTLR